MIKEHLNNILKIFKKDLKCATANPIVVFGLIAIMILPSLYSLVNIQACWDPYERTENLEFAVVNEDMGALYDGENINIGNELVDELKDNDEFTWKFVSLEEAREGVRNGKYIAALYIPAEFSKNITSLESDNPSSANLHYMVNDKNPVSSRMGDIAATTIQTDLNSKIIELIDIKAIEKLGILQSALSSGATQLKSGASQVDSGASQVSSGASELSAGAKQVTSGSKQISSGAAQVTYGAKEVSAGAEQLKQSVDISQVPDVLKPAINGSLSLADSSGSLAQGSSKLADSSVKLASGSSKIAKSGTILAGGSVKVARGSSKLANSAADGMSTAANSLDSVASADTDKVGEFISEPVHLQTEEFFPADCYGSEVAPFYLVLSIWVGCIISCVMLKMGYNDTEFSPLDFYFGKQALFLVMALGQCTVTTIGSLILGFQIDNIPLFILSMYLISIIFMFIVYSFSSVFGQLGKAFILIVLVLQISGTGGIYPVGVMNPLFQFLNPFLPMTYGIAMIKEACLGLVVENYLWSLAKLFVFPIVVFIISVLIKEKMDKSANYFEEKLKETGIF